MPLALESATTNKFSAELYVTVLKNELPDLFRPVVLEMSVTEKYRV
jgi:hypothetical protein